MSEGEASGRGWCERLYDEKAAQLLLYGRALGLSRGEAEDVLQETFIQLLGMAAPPESPAFYCLRAFRNRATNHRRSLWRRIARELEASRWFERGGGESAAERAAMRALETLPPEQREVIVLRIWHGRTYEEIGRLAGVPANTAAGRYRYGIQKIRALLTGANHEGLELDGEHAAGLGATLPLA